MKVAAAKGHGYIPQEEEDFEYLDLDPNILDNNYSIGYDDYGGPCGYGPVEDSAAAQANHYIELVGFAILLLQGIVSNVLAIPVLYTVSRRAWSTVIYLALLGGTDLIILLVQCGDQWYRKVTLDSLSLKIMSSSDALCKTYNFAFTCVKHLSPWLLVASSVEMLVATRWPRRTYIMCTLERARYVLMLMVIIIVCLDINYFWTYGVPKQGFVCVYTEDFSVHFRDWIWPAIDNTVELGLPLLVVSICFFLTATTMIRRPANRERDMEIQMKSYFLEPATLRDFRNVCLILGLVFMCLSTFKLTLLVTFLLLRRGYIEVDCYTLEIYQPTLTLLDTVSKTLFYAFYSFKIYLYLAISSHFRKTLLQGFFYIGRRVKRLCKTTKSSFAVPAKGAGKGRGGTSPGQTRPLIQKGSQVNHSNSHKSNIEVASGAADTSQEGPDLTLEENHKGKKDPVYRQKNSQPGLQNSDPIRNSLMDGIRDYDQEPVTNMGTKV